MVINTKSEVATEWEKLPTSLLTRYGKVVVSKDPNLSPETMKILSDTECRLVSDSPFFFNNDDSGSDIGFSSIAGLTAENPFACMAELVAIYCSLRHVSFYETATVLIRLKDQDQLYTIDFNHIDNGFYVWTPSIVKAEQTTSTRPEYNKSKKNEKSFSPAYNRSIISYSTNQPISANNSSKKRSTPPPKRSANNPIPSVFA